MFENSFHGGLTSDDKTKIVEDSLNAARKQLCAAKESPEGTAIHDSIENICYRIEYLEALLRRNPIQSSTVQES